MEATRQAAAARPNAFDLARFAGWALLLALASLTACVPSSTSHPDAPTRTKTVYTELPLAPPDDGTIVAAPGIDPPRVGSDAFSTEAMPGGAARGPRSEVLARVVQRCMAENVKRKLVGDRRLVELALALLRHLGADGGVEGRWVAYESQRLGIPFATPQTIAVRFSPRASEQQLEAELERALATLPANIPFARFGVGAQARGEVLAAMVVLQPSEVSFAPIPRHLHRGEAIVLKGAVAERFDTARVSVTRPDGNVRSWSADGRSFEAKVPVSHAGVWGLELLGDGPSGPVVVANFPVYVDAPDPKPPAAGPAGDAQPLTQKAVEDRLFELINQERARAHVPPVQRLDALVPIARAHGQDMADHDFFGHVSPTTGGPADRVKRAGLALSTVGENLGRGPSADDVHRMLMESPAHRGAMLEPRFTHAGVGAVIIGPPGAQSVIATELFTTIQGAVDPRADAAELLDAINRKRADAAAAPLSTDADLTRTAEAAAQRFATNPSWSLADTVRSAASELEHLAPRLTARGLRRTDARAVAVALVADAAELPSLRDPAASRVGIGLAVRKAAKGDPPLVIVVFVTGYANK